jgi:hypothetical protein
MLQAMEQVVTKVVVVVAVTAAAQPVMNARMKRMRLIVPAKISVTHRNHIATGKKMRRTTVR